MSFVTRRALSTLIPPKVSLSPHLRVLNVFTDHLQVASPTVSLLPPSDASMAQLLDLQPLPNNRGIERRKKTDGIQGIGAAQDAARMSRVVSFYEKLPRGSAPDVKPKGLFGRYQARYFGKNPSATRMFPESPFAMESQKLIYPNFSYHPHHRFRCWHRLCPGLLLPLA
jgi:hypothetical protein